MLNIGYDLKRKIGFQYLLDSMSACTPYGAELLKRAVPYTKEQEHELAAELNNVERAVYVLSLHEEDCRLLMQQFSLLKDIRRSLKKCLELTLTDVELFEIKRFLMNLRQIVPLFESIDRNADFMDIKIENCTDAFALLDPDEKNAPAFSISSAYSQALSAVRKEKRQIEEEIRRELEPQKREELLQKRLMIASAEENEEARIREELSVKLRAYIPVLEQDIQCIARLDAILQKALLAMKYGAAKPVLSDHIVFEGMVDPKLSDQLEKQGRHFTRVSVELKTGATVITGANMGGKSVALKMIALNVYLCQMGFFAFTKKAEFPLFDSMHFLFDDLQNPENSLSSFGAEVIWLDEAMKDILEGRFVLLLADEFARGTNPDEGALIVRALVRVLSSLHCVAVLTTHYDHAAEYAACHYQVVGLKNADIKKIASMVTNAKQGLEAIAHSMDYGLYKVEGQTGCPRDALNICRLLALNKNILEEIERYY